MAQPDSPPVVRLTFFKIADPADIEAAVNVYSSLQHDALKDGKPYLFASSCSPLHDNPASQGYTVAARLIFHSMEDMKYYEDECTAHTNIKETLRGRVTGPPLVLSMNANPKEAKRMIAMLTDTYGEDGEGKRVEQAVTAAVS